MGYIGTKPADAALTSADIADGVVTAAKLATDSVETAKVKDLNVSAGKLAATQDLSTKTITLPASVSGLGTGITAGQLTSTLDISSKTLTLPASVSGLGTGITNAQLAGSIDVTSKITGTVPTTNLGSGSASASTILYGDQSYKTEPAEYNDADIRNDLMTVALKQASQENMAKHNLPNSAVVTFQEDADFNLAGSTDISRNASKYISSSTTTVAEFTNDSNTLLLLHFDGSDASTTFTDSSSSSHTMTAGGNAQLDTAIKKLGTASLKLDGSDDYTTAPASSDWAYGTGDWTIEMWVYWNSGSIDTGKIIVFNGIHDQALEILLQKDSGNFLSYEIRNDSNTRLSAVDSGPVMAADTWYHIAYTRDGSTMRTYQDGVQGESQTGATGSYGDSSTTFKIGAKTSAQSIDGYLDEFRVSDTCRYPDGTTFTPNGTTSVSATGTALGTTNVPSSAVTEVSGVFLLKNAYGTNILGTDVKVYFTADNSNWTEATSYTSAGTFSTGITQITLGKTTVTSGSDVRWKIAFANQVADTKIADVYGIGTNY